MNAVETLLIPNEWLDFALQVAIGGACVSATVLAVAGLLWRRSEPLRYGILLTGVIGLLAVPALVALGRHCQDALPPFAAQPDDEVLRVPAEMLPALLTQPVADPPAAESPSAVGEFIGGGLMGVWGFGVIIGVCRLCHALWKQSRALAGSPWHAAFWTDDRMAQLARALGLKRFPAVHSSPAAPMPMVIGIWRPTIVLPEPAPAPWDQPQWEAVLLHEGAHIARGDPWALLAQRIAVILFWWCPLVYLLARRLNELRENICDDCAVQGSCDRIAYAELLVESAEHVLNLTVLPVPLGLLNSARGGLEARVTRLLEKERPTMTRLSLPGKLLGAAFLLAACLLTTAGTALSGGQPAPQKKIQIKIIVDGKEIDLGDAKLLEHIEAAQKKTAGDPQPKVLKAISSIGSDKGVVGEIILRPSQPAAPGAAVKPPATAAFSPDGNIIVSNDGKVFKVIDAKRGKVTAQVADPAKQGNQFEYRFTQTAPSKPDPRIEELVKQAEAIKPGSGAEIRKALQSLPKPADILYLKDPKAIKPVPAPPGVRFRTEPGKKVIIIEIEDGKLLHLSEGDLKKHLDDAIRLHLDLDVTKKKAADENLEKARAIELYYKAIREKTGDKKPTTPALPTPPVPPTPPATVTDVEALTRQLERINAELNELRKRLEDRKK